MSTSPTLKPAPVRSRLTLKVLAIDDDSFQLDLLSQLLRDMDIHDICCVTSGIEAMQKVAAKPDAFGLILMDLHMPGMDGFAFMEGLAQAHYSGAMVIVSGQSDDVLRGASLVARLRRFTLLGALAKPVQPADLARLLAPLF
jgi:CheY-like chemotaxis protein